MYNTYNQGNPILDMLKNAIMQYLNGAPNDQLTVLKKNILSTILKNNNELEQVLNYLTNKINSLNCWNDQNALYRCVEDALRDVIQHHLKNMPQQNIPNSFPQQQYGQVNQFPHQPVYNGFNNSPINNSPINSFRNTNQNFNNFNNNFNSPNPQQVNTFNNIYSSSGNFNNSPIQNTISSVPVSTPSVASATESNKEILPLLFEGDKVIKNETRSDGSKRFETDISNRKHKMNLDQFEFNSLINSLKESDLAFDNSDAEHYTNSLLIASNKNIILNRIYSNKIIYSKDEKDYSSILTTIKKAKDYEDLLVKLDNLYKAPDSNLEVLKIIDTRIKENLEKTLHKQTDYDLGYGVEPTKFCLYKNSIIEIFPKLKESFNKYGDEAKRHYLKELDKTFDRVKKLSIDILTSEQLNEKNKILRENHETLMQQFNLQEKVAYRNPLILTNKIILISCKFTNAELNIKFNSKDYDEKLIVPDNLECSIKKLIKFFEDEVEDYESYTFMLKTIDNNKYEISTDINFNKIWLSREYVFMY